MMSGQFFNILVYFKECSLTSNFIFQVKDIVMHTEMFSIENGLLTPTLKAKRPELRKYFQSQIDELYANAKM